MKRSFFLQKGEIPEICCSENEIKICIFTFLDIIYGTLKDVFVACRIFV